MRSMEHSFSFILQSNTITFQNFKYITSTFQSIKYITSITFFYILL